MENQVTNSIAQYLTKHGWSNDDSHFTRSIEIPGQKISINGQVMMQPSRTEVLHIDYLGEGAFLNVGEEDEPIYGYFLVNTDVWVSNFEDFKFWYEQMFRK